MIFTLLYLFLTLAPGMLITTLVGIRRQQLLFSVMFSFACLISLVSLARNHVWSVELFAMSYISLTLVLITLVLFFRAAEVKLQWRELRSSIQ
ncbi:MAG: hypothetical protein ACR2QW_16140, partial [bacterium]